MYMSNLTFSGRVSTLKRIRPKQSTKTIAKDEHNMVIGCLATHVPYLLKIICKNKSKIHSALTDVLIILPELLT